MAFAGCEIKVEGDEIFVKQAACVRKVLRIASDKVREGKTQSGLRPGEHTALRALMGLCSGGPGSECLAEPRP